jgi:hypothetical protein
MQFIQGMGLDKVIVELARLQRQRKAESRPGPGSHPPTEGRPEECREAIQDIARSLMTGALPVKEPAYSSRTTALGSTSQPGSASSNRSASSKSGAANPGSRADISSASSLVLADKSG